MCGIAGFFDRLSTPDIRSVAIARMTSALAHRGPDGQGCWSSPDGALHLGHRRLAIIDLSSAGAQPMLTADGRGVLVFNGEIYNFQALRSQLSALGVGFRGHSDTEVLLEALHHWGPADTLPRLNGMFAFAYWDARQQELILARDRMGEKPLYYAWQDGHFFFASELKALRAHPAFQARIDESVLSAYFRYGYVPCPHAIYKQTAKLPPAHWLRFVPTAGEPGRPQSYWSLAHDISAAVYTRTPITLTEAANETERLLRRSIAQRLVSDRPVGCFLSGGIDSSVVAALMQVQSSRPVRTFTIGYEEASFNEAADAERIARHLGTEHTTFTVRSRDALEVIPRLPEIYDEPFADNSEIPTFLLAQLTAQHVTVALSGDGGDEVFGGYNRYVWTQEMWPRMRRISHGVRALAGRAALRFSPVAWDRFFHGLERITPSRFHLRGPGDKLHKIALVAQAKGPIDVYRRLTSLWQNPESLRPNDAGGLLPFETLSPPVELVTPEEWMMYWDTLTYLPDDILVKVDRATMAVGLEGRIPFLDNDLMAFAWRLPMESKIHGGVGKRVIRVVLERYMPRTMFDRPKTGFGIPIGAWLRGPLRDWAEAMFESPALAGCIEMKPVRQVWRQHLAGGINAEHRLWPVLMLAAWLQANAS